MWVDWNTSIFRPALDSSGRITVVAAAVATILWMARIRSSSLQHKAWTVVLGAMLGMPVLSSVVPPVRMPGSITLVVDKVPDVEAIARTATHIASRSNSGSAIPPASISPADSGSLPEHSLWPFVSLMIYAAGFLGLLFRLGLGWLGIKRLLRSARAEATPEGATVLESAFVSTPLTCGVVHPRCIVSPQGC